MTARDLPVMTARRRFGVWTVKSMGVSAVGDTLGPAVKALAEALSRRQG